MIKSNKVRRGATLRLEMYWLPVCDGEPIAIAYCTADHWLRDPYAIIPGSDGNGLWVVSRWGRTDEWDAVINYFVFDPASVDEEDWDEIVTGPWCSCRCFQNREDTDFQCRHMRMVAMVKERGPEYWT